MNEDEDDLVDTFFEYFFPCAAGHAKLIDNFYSNNNYLCCKSERYYSTKFEDEESDDPEWIVKKFYFILIAAITEVYCGVDNSWKSSKSEGRIYFSNSSKHIAKTYFKEFLCATPHFFVEKKR